MWQELRSELHPQGVEIVTVALDAGGVEAAAPFIDAANAEHPSLIDAAHELDARLGVTNVPMAVWIDEDGVLVRPPEVAHPGRVMLPEILAQHPIPQDAPQYLLDTLAETAKIRIEPQRYAAALRDWAVRGAESEYALSPDEVVARSRARPSEASAAAAHFELGQHLYAAGELDAARRQWRESHRLDPTNWTYRRQAWSL